MCPTTTVSTSPLGALLPASTFARAFRRFCRAVAAAPDSPGPFISFQEGLPKDWESYKTGVYAIARERLGVKRWKQNSVGSGKIIEAVIRAIEIEDWDGNTNNLVEWRLKGRKPGSESHRKLLDARKSKKAQQAADAALFRMYREEADPEACFAELTELFGARFDLISYLFFLRDWNTYMPVRPTRFSDAFALLEMPLALRGRCKWETYELFLKRLQAIKARLSEQDIPGGISLLDAHSFCWMLAGLPPAPEIEVTSIETRRFLPVPGSAPQRGSGLVVTTPEKLDDAQKNQRRIGKEAEAVVIDAERKRLHAAGRSDLAGQVRDVSEEIGLGYDIESFTTEGTPRRIEVKAAASRGDDLRFFLSENERLRSLSQNGYVFNLVTDLNTPTPTIFEFDGTELPAEALYPVNYEVRLLYPAQP